MGGLLFNTQRLPLKEFNEYRSHVESILDSHDIEYKIPLYYRSKKDFGDLDILIKTTVPNKKLLNIFQGCENHYDNIDENISFNYKDFQIDFIKVKPQDFEIAFHYYSWNDLGNLIGQLAKFNYLKFGYDGLRYDHYNAKKQKKRSIYLSKNIDKILTFLDLDPVKFHEGFDTIEEVFDFIIKSKYFNPYVSDLEPYAYNAAGVAQYHINKVNRERNYKRKTYQEWLEYVKPLKTGEENYKFRSDIDLDDTFNRIDEFFPEAHLKEMVYTMNKEENDKKLIKLKFNGNIIMKLLPEIKNNEMQTFIDAFKAEHSNFSDYIFNTEQDRINKDIINFFKIYK